MKKILIVLLLIGLIGLTYMCSQETETPPAGEEPVDPVETPQPADPPVVEQPVPDPETAETTEPELPATEPETSQPETPEPETTPEPDQEPARPDDSGLSSSGYMPNLPLDDPSLRLYKGMVDPRSVTPHVLTEVTTESLVNKFNILPDDYAPEQLVAINANGVSGMVLQPEAAEAWEKWRQAALDDGYTVLAVSSYRSGDYQASLFNNYYANHGDEAILWSAYPRRSEHELGLVLDLSHSWGLPGEEFGDTPMGRYLADTAADYGFILRYPKGYEADTGYVYEPWHFRYVGPKIAQKMKRDNIPTLEHYYKLTVEQTN